MQIGAAVQWNSHTCVHLAVCWYQQEDSIWYEVSLRLEYVAPYRPSEFRATVVLLDANAAQTFVFQINENLHFIKTPCKNCWSKRYHSTSARLISLCLFPPRYVFTVCSHILRGTRTEVNVKGAERKTEKPVWANGVNRRMGEERLGLNLSAPPPPPAFRAFKVDLRLTTDPAN